MTEVFKIHQEFEVTIERMSFGPRAVARIAHSPSDRPLVVFVEGGAPGDRARIRLTHQHKNYWEAEIVELLSPSKDRVKPLCAHFGRCGGCQWQHLTYEAQLASKKDILLHQLEKTTKLEKNSLESIFQIHAASDAWNYRTRAQIRGKKNDMGFFEKHSRTLVPVTHCPVLHPNIREKWKEFRRERLSTVAHLDEFKVEWTRTEDGQVLESLNQPHAALGFSQVNAAENKKLCGIVDAIASKATSMSLLWDLYGGNGNLVRNLVSRFKTTVTVDEHVEQPLNSNHLVVRSKVEKFLKSWDAERHAKPDVILTDPPRTGLEKNAKTTADIRANRVILVSCDPSTLARDLASFIPHYTIESVHLIDMFPQTYHLESVVELVLKNR